MPRTSNLTKTVIVVLVLLAAVKIYFRFWPTEDAGLDAAELLLDEAKLMSAEQSQYLARYHHFLLKDHDIDYRVITGKNVGEIAQYGIDQFAELGVGDKSGTGRGLLLVIDPQQDLVRLEVSRSLEGVYTDAFVTYIQHRQMVPFFIQDRVADGIVATTELIVSQAQGAVKNAAFDSDEAQARAAGGGATAKARLGAGSDDAFSGDAQEISAGESPQTTLLAYLDAMHSRNADRDLDIYTEASRKMLAGWVMTPAQMDNVVRTYRACHPQSAKMNGSGTLAVIRYPIKERLCSPWFFQKENGRWRLDLTMMQTAIRFGRSNAWHFDKLAKHPYDFAFRDWRFDRNGFPIKTS